MRRSLFKVVATTLKLIKEMDDEQIDTSELKDQALNIWKRLDAKDLIIIALILLMLLMYMYHTRQIDYCVKYFNELLTEKAAPLRIWNIT